MSFEKAVDAWSNGAPPNMAIRLAQHRIAELEAERDEALRQVAVLREALEKIRDHESNSDFANSLDWSDGQIPTVQIAEAALSETLSPGVMCESEPVGTYIGREREYDYDVIELYESMPKGTPIYRKKGES